MNDKAPSTGQLLTIGEFSRRSRLSLKALRMYDRRGLLAPADVDPRNGYRRCRESQLEMARLIVLLRRLDMPLALIAWVVAATTDDAIEMIDLWWQAKEQRIMGQRTLVSQLLQTLSGVDWSNDMYNVEEREIPEQRLLTEQRIATAAGLPDWIGETIDRHFRTADAFGGVVGPPLVIFHAEVTETSEGPVEVCAPIGMDANVPDSIAARIEPAHREAYVRIPKRQVQFPEILSAYDAVEAWIRREGKTMTGSPREVYFADFMAAGPDDDVCDVAFPIR